MTDLAAETDVSDAPRIFAKNDVEHRGIRQTIKQGYVPPLDGSPDDMKLFDTTIARDVARVLVKSYPGYSWHVVADSRQGVVYFGIPELMGPSLRYVINLGQFADLTPKLVMICAGELLERMGLRRGAIDLGEYFAAKTNKERFDFADAQKGRR